MSSFLQQCAGGLTRRRFSASKAWYDHIVVGAGTAGVVLASRLAALGSKVLLVEQRPRRPAPLFGGLCGARPPPPRRIWAEGRRAEFAAFGPAWCHESWARIRESYEAMMPAPEAPEYAARCAEFARACSDLSLADDAAGGLYHVLPEGWAQEKILAEALAASGADGQQLELRAPERVERVRVECGRAVGVEWAGGSANAGEVVLCAGVVDSPHLLLSSGIGPAEALLESCVHVVRNLPGVGANLQDHVVLEVPAASEAGCPAEREASSFAFPGSLRRLSDRFGLGAAPSSAVAGLYARSEASLPHPDLFMTLLPSGAEPSRAEALGAQAGAVEVALIGGRARGRVALDGASPLVRFDALADAEDRRALARGARMACEALDRCEGLRPPQPETSDEAYLRSCRQVGRPVGTCAMGQGAMSVVDGDLCVHGLEGLRVADASVLPSADLSADSCASTVLIAEVAARLLAKSMASYHRSQYGMPPVAAPMPLQQQCA